MQLAMATPLTAALDAGSPQNRTSFFARRELGDGDEGKKALKDAKNEASNQTFTKDINSCSRAAAAAGQLQQGSSNSRTATAGPLPQQQGRSSRATA
ncbi:hypothetical protein QJQ45_010001 [Haematococcus lacustris]|nr:hypothetical protein QJQ45_010001 [Haematococcus lacustris]